MINAKYIGHFYLRTGKNNYKYLSSDYIHSDWELGKLYLKEYDDKVCPIYVFWESENFINVRSYSIIELEFKDNQPKEIIKLKKQLIIKEIID